MLKPGSKQAAEIIQEQHLLIPKLSIYIKFVAIRPFACGAVVVDIMHEQAIVEITDES